MLKLQKLLVSLFVLAGVSLALGACSPEVGSKEWCEEIKARDKTDITAQEAADFTKSCVF
jgi:Protein of unknown function (DUF3012)